LQEISGPVTGSVFVDHKDDLETASEIENILTRNERTTLVAHIRDPMLRRLIRTRLDARNVEPRPILFGLAETIARELVQKERLFDQAYWRDQPCLHALVIGFTALGRACMEEAIFAGIAGHLAPPRITILDPDPDRVIGLIAREMPELAKSADVNVFDFESSAVADHANGPLIEAEDASPLTAIFVCLADERQRIALMDVLARLQTRHDRALAPVFILSETRSRASVLACPIGSSGDIARRFVVAGGCPIDSYASLVSTRGDMTAERLHEAYRTTFGGEGASNAPWANLSETYRDSNRHAARHLPQKLWTAGLTWSGLSWDTGAVAPEPHTTIIEPCIQSTGEDALMRRLARLEHDRWCAERRLGGWCYGQNRDELRQFHPKLVSFDDPRITDRDIAKDIEQIRFLFRTVVVPSSQGASVPLVIGVLATGTRGIDIEGAQAILDFEPWRPVIFLSALADENECSIVEKLVARLHDAGRAFHLLVVEQPGTGRFIDRIKARASPTLASLMARPEARIVPIRGETPLGEEWTDPETIGDNAKTLADYIERRANAVVVTRTESPSASS
jgi:hypothetical protein